MEVKKLHERNLLELVPDWWEIRRSLLADQGYLNWLAWTQFHELQSLSRDHSLETIIFDHGWNHVQRVARTVVQLLADLDQGSALRRIGYITALTHDIGMSGGKSFHAHRGGDMVPELLVRTGLVRDEPTINHIADAIRHHGDGDETPDLLTGVLTLADKADMCRARALGNFGPLCEIDDYHVRWSAGILRYDYRLRSPAGRDSFYFVPKSLQVPSKIAAWFGWQVEFYLDGQRETFADRDQYQGRIYHRDETADIPYW